MVKLLIADDEPDIRQLICRAAQAAGYQTCEAADGEEAIELCQKQDFDVIVMDVMMPGIDGFAACEEIRRFKDIPVLMLSARGAEYDKLRGFEAGVDDYVVKPFSPKELMARIQVIAGRHQSQRLTAAPARQVITLNGLQIDLPGRNVYIDGQSVDLTAKEYDLLLYFIENKGIALTRAKILNGVWGYNYFGDERTVDWQIKLLRNKLGNYRHYIVTLRGVGYKFEVRS